MAINLATPFRCTRGYGIAEEEEKDKNKTPVKTLGIDVVKGCKWEYGSLHLIHHILMLFTLLITFEAHSTKGQTSCKIPGRKKMRLTNSSISTTF